MKWRRWAEFSVRSTLLFCWSAPRCRSSSSSRLHRFQQHVLEKRCYSTVMAEEAKKLAAYAAVDNHIQVSARARAAVVSLALCARDIALVTKVSSVYVVSFLVR